MHMHVHEHDACDAAVQQQQPPAAALLAGLTTPRLDPVPCSSPQGTSKGTRLTP